MKNTKGFKITTIFLDNNLLTPNNSNHYITKDEAMSNIKLFESEGLEKYELLTFNKVSNGGFVELNEWVGGSPDGFIKPGLVECKCPKYSTQIDYLVEKKLPKIYEKQVQGQLYVTGAKWCDFMCYHPKLKPLIIRIERDEEMIKEIADKLTESIEKTKQLIKLIS